MGDFYFKESIALHIKMVKSQDVPLFITNCLLSINEKQQQHHQLESAMLPYM